MNEITKTEGQIKRALDKRQMIIEMQDLRRYGWTYQKIAYAYQVSRQYVHQLIGSIKR